MDLFYSYCPISTKNRVHYNSFMLSVHSQLHLLKKTDDPVDNLCRRIAQEHKVICLDEFQVVDIADAMILRKLLGGLLGRDVRMVLTSNRPPSDLYLNGIQRTSFLPCIRLIEERMEVVHLASESDYRKSRGLADLQVFLWPINKESESAIGKMIERLKGEEQLKRSSISTFGREIIITRCNSRMAVFTFDELCKNPMSAADYTAIASTFSIMVIEMVPIMKVSVDKNEMRRFITLIDILYDQRIKLAMQMDASSSELFDFDVGIDRGAHEEVFALDRTISRLTEMSSPAWWAC